MLLSFVFSFWIFLLQSVLALENQIYFLNNSGIFIFNVSDNVRNDPFIWEWKPHSGQQITKQLGIFHRDGTGWKVQWNKECNDIQSTYSKIDQINSTLNLRITRPGFELAGLFSCRQGNPSTTILAQYEMFGIKVETDTQSPEMGSDITLSCTISRLLDTVNLHWKQRALFRKNGRDKIHLNNTVYLLVRSIRRLDVNLYTCEVQKNGTAIITENIYVNQVKYDFHDVEYTCFRSSTVHSEFHLVSNTFFWTFHDFTWTWKSDRYPNQDEQIASFPPLHLKKTYFGSRIITSSWYYMTSIQITPVLFGDAGVYTLTADSAKRKTIKLIIVKVTAEPSDAETEEDSITLTCSVSDVTESIRLVWINSIGKVVAEKTVTGHNEKEKSLHLIIQKADRVKGNWTCVLLHQNSPKVIIPYYLEITRNTVFFSENSNNFVLNGPEHAGNGPVTWEWKPHSGQQLTKQLGIFHSDGTRWKVQWSKEYNDTQSLHNQINQVNGTLNLRITRPGFELAGMFSCRQGQSSTIILKQYELFGIKVGTVPWRLVAGSDITLNCTISRFSDTLSLHWKQRYPFQHNRGNNTDEIRLNDSVYLIIRNIERNSFTCEVQENDATVITAAVHLYPGRYYHASIIDTRYRSSTSYSEFHLVSDIIFWGYRHFAWVWMSHHYPNQDRQIASFNTSHHVNLNRSYFGNRITTQHNFWRHDSISVQIAPVLFDDAGVYALIVDSVNHVTITLITVKVTVEPSDAVTEGDSVTLTCSVSNVTEAIRLAWINSDGKSVLEKTLTGQNGEEKSLSLIIQKADRCKWHWMCVLFDQNNPRVSIPYNLEITRRSCMDTWILAFSGYLLVKLIIAIGLITSFKMKIKQKSG